MLISCSMCEAVAPPPPPPHCPPCQPQPQAGGTTGATAAPPPPELARDATNARGRPVAAAAVLFLSLLPSMSPLFHPPAAFIQAVTHTCAFVRRCRAALPPWSADILSFNGPPCLLSRLSSPLHCSRFSLKCPIHPYSALCLPGALMAPLSFAVVCGPGLPCWAFARLAQICLSYLLLLLLLLPPSTPAQHFSAHPVCTH